MGASKFTAERRADLIVAFAAGASIPDASTQAGVSEKTLKGWLQRGRRDDAGDYHEFAVIADRVRRAGRRFSEPMDEDELARAVSHSARHGNVQAMKLRLEMLRGDDDEGSSETAPPGSLAALDEVARRRATRAAAE